MFDEPITTLEQAKSFLIEMGGSPYEMTREFPRRYDEYKSLNIPKETEVLWREELLANHFNSIKESKDANQLWIIHSNMNKLYEDLKTDTALMTMLEATKYLRGKVPIQHRVMVAETVNGRTARQARLGLIYMAFDSNNISAAKAFIELSLHFSTYDGQDQYGIERSRKATQLCNDIKLELGL
ncbi:MAG: hypothetical protein ABI904_21025 [Chloroflexota bacterium]